MQGLVLIEVCSSNLASVPQLFELEQNYSEVTILENDCQSYCAVCATGPYVLYEGDLLSSDDVPSLIEQLQQRIEQAEITDDL